MSSVADHHRPGTDGCCLACRPHPSDEGIKLAAKVQQPAGIAVLHQALSTITPALDR